MVFGMATFLDDDGNQIDASYSIEGGDLILHSRGGAKSDDARNVDYGPALRLLLQRIKTGNISLARVLVDSSRTINLPLEERTIFTSEDANLSDQNCSRSYPSAWQKSAKSPGP